MQWCNLAARATCYWFNLIEVFMFDVESGFMQGGLESHT